MKIAITFRQMDPSDAIKKYADTKLARLQKLLVQPMSAKLTLSVQKQQHVAEVLLSSGGNHIEARESGEDLYACIDMVLDKLERQISASKGEKVSKARRSTESVRTSTPPEAAGMLPETAPAKLAAPKKKADTDTTSSSRKRAEP